MEQKATANRKKKNVSENERIAMRVSGYSIIVNILLSVFKLFAGIIAHSGAMISDGVHSASDVLSTIIVIIGVKISSKESDRRHPYGHERLECVAAILLSVMLGLTGVGIGLSGIEKIMQSFRGELNIVTPGLLALTAAVISIVVKESMYWYTRSAAKKIKSGAMMADAWHHRSDALSSIGSFAGICGARLGYPVLDPVASIVICAFIIKAAADIFMDAVRKMTDEAWDEKDVAKIRKLVLRQEGVRGIDELKTRVFGSRVYVDLEISADGERTLKETHRIAEKVHHAIEEEFEDVKHCMVHVNPYVERETEKEKNEKLQSQMDFILELDRLKQIQRQTYITGDQRKENDAEHSWHLAVMSIILADYAEVPLDLTKVLTMVLIHDVVEIDAGDTYAYDEEGNATKRQREEAAANRLFGILPRQQAESMRAVWEEFEQKETPEAKFANTMDRVQPILLNDATNGDAWKEHKVTAAQILNRNRSTWEGAPQVWKYAETLIHKHIQNGDIQEDRR